MTRSTSLPLRLAALLGSAAIIAACTGTTASPSAAPATEAPSASAAVSEAPYDGMAYPADGEAPCGVAPYTGNDQEDHRGLIGLTRPVPPVRARSRVPAEGRVQRLRDPRL